jgi:hypothetical protein
MKIRMRYVLPALVMLAGCATTNDQDYSANATPAPTAAVPQRVDAVSDVLGARMDSMLAAQPTNGAVTR